MRPVLTDELKGYIEPLTRMGKGDSIEFPAVHGGDKPRFRLLVYLMKRLDSMGGRGWVYLDGSIFKM
jgi:hypothetical protein